MLAFSLATHKTWKERKQEKEGGREEERMKGDKDLLHALISPSLSPSVPLSVPPSLYLLPYEQSAPRHSRGHLRGPNGRTGWTGRKSVKEACRWREREAPRREKRGMHDPIEEIRGTRRDGRRDRPIYLGVRACLCSPMERRRQGRGKATSFLKKGGREGGRSEGEEKEGGREEGKEGEGKEEGREGGKNGERNKGVRKLWYT